MDAESLIYKLALNGTRIDVLASGVTTEQAHWKPAPDSWSIQEVIHHLLDEEKFDFRVRLDLILHQPDADWPPIDPAGWVVERKYNEKDLSKTLEGLQNERADSLSWLKSLGEVDWDSTHIAPFGSIRAGDMFTAWVTHDELHMRQLVELHRAYTELEAAPYSLEYAGPW